MPFVDHFLAEPLDRVPARRPGSLRRTSSVDMVGRDDGTILLLGAALDPDGAAASCRAVVAAADRELLSLEADPVIAGSDTLIGRPVGRGFRAVVDSRCPPGTLASVLLCELAVAALLSGYGSLYTGHYPSPIPDAFLDHLPVDICAGWVASGSFMTQIRSSRDMPTPAGPVSPGDGDDGAIGDDIGGIGDDDAIGDDKDGTSAAWHAMPPLEPGSMRRQRLIEREGSAVWAMFRDSYARPDGVVTVLHEYSVAATLTPDGQRVAACVATPRVLPWDECPGAASSAGRLVGRRVADLRALVKDELVGTSTCTHLNDLLASLSQADHLV